MLGGLGVCGRPFCCGSFMDDFKPVSTKMAKVQNLSLNPAKISGCCGRLMCCLRYEQPAYEELVKSVPKNGAFVETPDGYGNVNQVNILRQKVRVKLDGDGDDAFRIYDVDEVAAVPGGRPRDGSQPPHVLQLKPKKAEQAEPEEDPWQMPERLITAPAEEQPAPRPRPEPAGGEEGRPGRGRNRRRGKKNGQAQENKSGAPQDKPRQSREQNRNQPRPKADVPTPQEQSQKARSKNYYSRRRPHNRRPKNENGGRQDG